MDKDEKQIKKDVEKLIYPNHLKYLKKLKAQLKKDKGMKPRRNWNPFRKREMNSQSMNLFQFPIIKFTVSDWQNKKDKLLKLIDFSDTDTNFDGQPYHRV